MDVISGEYFGLFVRYSGIDIRVSLLFCFVFVGLMYFFLGVPFFVPFHTRFHKKKFTGRRKRERFTRQGFKSWRKVFIFWVSVLNHVEVTILGFLDFPYRIV